MSRFMRLWVLGTGVIALALLALYFATPDKHKVLEAVAARVPTLIVSTESLTLKPAEIGGSSAELLTLSNASLTQPLTITSLFLDEVDSKYFALSHQAPLTLAPDESLSITISFEAAEQGSKTGSLFINHDGDEGVLVVDLHGSGRSDVEPELAAAQPQSFPFSKSALGGFVGTKPTSLQFGPDGRLYVATMLGEIHVMTIERTSNSKYKVTDKEIITKIKNIPNHNDNGKFNPNIKQRLITGIAVEGTATQPVIYVHSSDPRIGGGPSGNITGLDTNSGILSRLTKNGNTWSKLDLVRGLPRSDENHHSNGIVLAGDKLYLATGGNTNMGAPSKNFGGLPEFALSAAILEIDLAAIGESTYDLPTLNDEDRPGINDSNDPFGGNRGKNQAKLVPNGPVQVYSPGWRNPYDLVIMQNGYMYSWDNGPNAGWGGAPSNCSNKKSEPGTTQHDALHLIEYRGYYAGHPNPTRAHQKNKFNNSNPQSPVTVNNLVECNYYGPGVNGNGVHPKNEAHISLPLSTNGLAEYTASNFNGQMNGDLLVVSWDNKVYRVVFDASGEIDKFGAMFSNVGNSPLDVTALSDADPFPGTIWVADFQGSNIIVYEPGDYQGNANVCIAGNGNGDADDDGFTDADELANGSNPCSSADSPADADGDFISDFTDPDDDNDGIKDVNDPFALDSANGAGTPLDIDYQWENGSEGAGFLGNLGFSGLMTNGVTDYQSMFDFSNMTIIGAAGVVTIDEVSAGDAFKAKNNQQYGFQFGVDVTPDSGVFRTQTRILAPFSGVEPADYQSMGLYIGTGDQDNYLKLVINSDGFQLLAEVNGQIQLQQNTSVPITGLDHVDLVIEVDPAATMATGFYQITESGNTAAELEVGTFVFPLSWLTANTRLAVGIVSTSIGAQPFTATWDFLAVKSLQADNSENTPPLVSIETPANGMVNLPLQLFATISDQESYSEDLSVQWSIVDAPGEVSISDLQSLSPMVNFSTGGVYELMLTASDGLFSTSETVLVTVSSSGVNSDIVYRLNVGGPVIPQNGGNWEPDGPFVNTGNVWSSTAFVDAPGLDGVPPKIFNTERYDPFGGPDMQWSLPVIPGRYEVRLYFAEIFFGAMASGVRVFDAYIEDAVIGGIDPYASAGSNNGFVEKVVVDSDETLDIMLKRVAQNPALKGIEIIRVNSANELQNKAPDLVISGASVVKVGGTTTLEGIVADDGLPTGSLNLQWEVVEENSGVVFSSAFSAETDVTFSKAGKYTLTLTASDGDLSSVATHSVSVTPQVVNKAPVVSAGADVQVYAGTTLTLNASVQDDGLPAAQLSSAWTVESGPASAEFDNVGSLKPRIVFSTPGIYVLRLSATDSDLTGYDDVVINVKSTVSDSAVKYRINVGGGKLEFGEHVWSADDSSYVSGSSLYSVNGNINAVAVPGVPSELFKSERWSAQAMTWSFPVVAGQYKVNLYFAEIYPGAMNSGARNFDVLIEGNQKGIVDAFAEAGQMTGLVKSYLIQSDSSLDITLSPITQNPAIKGIEVIAVSDDNEGSNLAPSVSAGEDQSVLIDEVVVLSGTVSDDGFPNNPLSLEWALINGPGPVTMSSPQESVTSVAFSSAGDYIFELTADDGEFVDTDTVTVSLNSPDPLEVVYRINAGGSDLMHEGKLWQGDSGSSSFVSSGKFWKNNVPIDTAVAIGYPEQLFTTERYNPAGGADMKWALPVSNGSYEVSLFFSEIWNGAHAQGQRVFDVSVESQATEGIDVYAEVGAFSALVKTFTVAVSDGELNIDFMPVVQNPSVKGIEVRRIN